MDDEIQQNVYLINNGFGMGLNKAVWFKVSKILPEKTLSTADDLCDQTI